jgi:hypothetical protein
MGHFNDQNQMGHGFHSAYIGNGTMANGANGYMWSSSRFANTPNTRYRLVISGGSSGAWSSSGNVNGNEPTAVRCVFPGQ